MYLLIKCLLIALFFYKNIYVELLLYNFYVIF